jgi:hypothetical protein
VRFVFALLMPSLTKDTPMELYKPALLRIAALSFFFLFAIGCDDKDEYPMPDIYVNIVINPASISYNNLNIPGNYALIKGGYRGIIVYHFLQDEYLAYERTCTYDWDKNCSKLVMDPSGLIARDTCCGSQFLIIDGTPLEGSPATRPLKQYKTYYDANFGRLYITN